MSFTDSVSEWIPQLRRGDSDALEALWSRYQAELVEEAQKRLRKLPKGVADGEDIAESVLISVCRAAYAGRLQHLRDRDDLWWLLLCITHEKVVRIVRRELSQKRGSGRVRPEASVASNSRFGRRFSLDQLISSAPSPDFVATLNDQSRHLMHSLPDDRMRRIAVCRIEGYTVPEIADEMEITPRSVERKLQLIRKKWARELERAH
jgi:DNA-directed RNA polymerase specialized sigma24 family protein